MTELPPELEAFASLLDAQPQPAREIFHYCLCLMMVEVNKMSLVETIPGEASPICVFETASGDMFSINRPPMTEEQEAQVLSALRDILRDEGLL